MTIKAEIILDSFNARNGARLTTWKLTYPRFIHSELMTHRAFSRNAASSRAIPVNRMLANILEDTAKPIEWGANQPGMQAEGEIDPHQIGLAEHYWQMARNNAIYYAREMEAIGVHKHIVNRLVEPFAHMTTLVSATDFENFFALRAHPDAAPEFRALAYQMLDIYNASKPARKLTGDWHIPFGDQMPDGLDDVTRRKIAVARIARISYLTHDGAIDVAKDIELHDRLATSGHWSPFEHVAAATHFYQRFGNFCGWHQYRRLFPGENRSDPRVRDW